ncbi:MAG TPA: hypothetical protein VLK25_00420 [Allosphingosinicella sp.]|nr:hypothetical protein [Allosphingosinicella sp.]
MNELLDFTKPLYEAIIDLAASQADDAAKAGIVDRSIYAQKRNTGGYYDVPHSVYFYYVRVNTNGQLEVTHYFYPYVAPGDDPADHSKWNPIPHDRAVLEGIITALAQNARPIRRPRPGEQARVRYPPISGYRFENMEWEYKSYIVFFIDEVNWKFHKPPNTDPVVFITTGKDGKIGCPNWSFFDALDFDITMPIGDSVNTDERSAIAFINHMKADDLGRDVGEDASGNPIPGPRPTERQLFQFQMYLDVYFTNGTSKMTVILDPDGNNLGPPLPPP